jgi:hypothetical protein
MNFAYDDEARKFYEVVASKIVAKTRRSEIKNPRNGGNTAPQSMQQPQQQTKVFPSQLLTMQPVIHNVSLNDKYANENAHADAKPAGLFSTLKGNKKQKKAAINKAAISNPTQFRHVQHVGLSNKTTEKFEV